MKLFVKDRGTQGKIYLNVQAATRSELISIIGSQFFSVNGQPYHVNEVDAETDANNTASGAIVGGLIGLMAGPLGILAGGLIGGMLGNSGDKGEIQKVSNFKNSRV